MICTACEGTGESGPFRDGWGPCYLCAVCGGKGRLENDQREEDAKADSKKGAGCCLVSGPRLARSRWRA